VPVVDARRRAPRPLTQPPAEPPTPAVRLVPLDLDAPALAAGRSLLTDEERAHADRGTAPVARQRIALRAGLRRLAGDVLGLPPSDVPLRTGAHGRPELDVPGFDVSCSRSGGLGLVAVAFRQRVGVDVERVTAWDDAVLAEQWLTDSERRQLTALVPASRAAAAARCWTRKEAVLKGIGTGLLAPADELEVGIAAGAVLVAGWRVADLPVPGGHVATLATRILSRPVPVHPVPTAHPDRSPDGHAHS
jgi:4'-phosphopantetheinyl transferase